MAIRSFRPGEAQALVNSDPRAPEHFPNFSLDRQIAQARKEMGEKRWAELQEEWK
ncbi:hypothetical protein [Novosphingobium colocasiae]|uniref:hypothetical protein n=1 Tax=Novosphingobium colocasiae TaxID=1256513 RepID=UPI0035B2E29F